MDETTEKVKKALDDAWFGNQWKGGPPPEDWLATAAELAMAAHIQALTEMEPTGSMRVAFRAAFDDGRVTPSVLWKALIQAYQQNLKASRESKL